MRVLAREPQHKLPDPRRQRRSPAAASRLSPLPTHQRPMPAQQRPRTHQKHTPRRARQVTGGGCKQRPISGAELWPRHLPAQDLQLLAQHQQLDISHMQAAAANKRTEQRPHSEVKEREDHAADPPSPRPKEKRHQFWRPSGLHHQSERRLGDPAGAQPQLHGCVRADALPDPRPRQQVRRHLRRGLPQRGDQCHPHPDPRSTSKRLRRALRPHRPRRMSRLGPDHRPPPPRDSPPHLHDPLQPRAPSPRTRAASARPDKRGPAAERRRNQTPRPTRRTDPRIPPRRSMNRRFETPQDRSRSPSWLTPDALTGAPFPNDAQHERLLTAAPRGGLEPPPAGRLRRAKPPSPAQHRSRKIEASTSTLLLRSWHTDLELLRAPRPRQQPDEREQVPYDEIRKRPEQAALLQPRRQERRT